MHNISDATKYLFYWDIDTAGYSMLVTDTRQCDNNNRK